MLVFNIKEVNCFGITKYDFEVSAYNFLVFGIFSDFDGVIGLDFFRTNKSCIDLENRIISIK